jgi:hypothetical protein
MVNHSPRPQSELKIVTAIGRELERAAERDRQRSRLRRPFYGRGARTLALGFVCLLAVATTAGAAAGVLDVGSVIPGGKPTGPPENRLDVDETILASGIAPVAGPWQIRTYKSKGIVYQGEVLEQAGAPCIRLVLTDPPAGTLLTGSGFCGEAGNSGFDIADVPVRDSSGRVVVLLFGHTPEGAAGVELTAGGGKRIRVDTLEGPADVPGDVWEMTVPPDLENARVDWLHQDGTAAGADLNASIHLDRGRRLASGPPTGG